MSAGQRASTEPDNSLGKTRLGRWYWSRTDRQMGWFMVWFDLAIWVVIFGSMMVTGAPTGAAFMVANLVTIIGNLGLVVYNTSKL